MLLRTLLVALCALYAAQLPAQDTDCSDCTEPAVAVAAAYTSEFWRQASGGLELGNRYLDNLDLTVDIDAERALDLDGLRLFAYALYNNGNVLCDDLVGSMQCVSNIESVSAVRLYELWADWRFAGSADAPSSVRFGLYDLNSEFDGIDSAALFISPSHGIGPDFSQSGRFGPSIFPVTSLGLRVKGTWDAWSLQAAVLDGVPGDPEHPARTAVHLSKEDGALLIGEANYRADSGLRLAGGYWRYTAEFEDLTVGEDEEPRLRDDNGGAYVILEYPLLGVQPNETGASNGLNFFMRLGIAEPQINAIERYLGGGAVYSRITGAGRTHSVGLSAAIATLGTPYREAQAAEEIETTAHERVFEATYRVEVTSWLTLQSDLQYTQYAGMDPAQEESWTVGLRFEVAHEWLW